MREQILEFIVIFYSKENEILFTECACYYFAKILQVRFGGEIYYNPSEIHFATLIEGNLYDIRGIIDISGFLRWDDYDDINRIMVEHHCIQLRR